MRKHSFTKIFVPFVSFFICFMILCCIILLTTYFLFGNENCNAIRRRSEPMVGQNTSQELRPYEELFREAYTRTNLMPFEHSIQEAKTYLQNLNVSYCTQSTTTIRMTILTTCFGHSIARLRSCRITTHRLQEYAQKHNYTFILYSEPLVPLLEYHWQKIPIILKQLEISNLSRDDIIAWFDDDTYITNIDTKIEQFLCLVPETVDLIFSRSLFANDPYQYLNTGIFFVRSSPIAKEFFKQVYQMRTEMVYFLNHYFFEQSVMTLVYYRNFSRNAIALPSCLMQSFWTQRYKQWSHGDFVIHLPSTDSNVRRKLFKYLSNHPVEMWANELGSQKNMPCHT